MDKASNSPKLEVPGRDEAGKDPASLAQTQKLAEIGLMTSALLHEIKQPLAGVKGTAQLLKERPELAEQAEFILTQVERIEQLIGDQRRFLHAGVGTRATVDLQRIASAAVALLGPKARHAGVQLALRGEAAEVQGSEGQLLQILANLLANAVDAVVLGGGEKRWVEVVVRSDGPAREVLVADWGAGIAPNSARRLFTPFYTTKGPEVGTGLGLYISRTLAEANGATLEPVPPESVGSQAKTVFRLRFAPAAATGSSRPAVLIVDDEEVICSLLTNLLRGEGYEIQLAATGDEALRLIAERRWDLVLSDKNLPGASGLQVARAARERWGCPVILMTGYSSLEAAQEGLAVGLVDYLEKPFDDIGEVRRRIREVLEPKPVPVPTPVALPAPAAAGPSARRVLIVEDRSQDAAKIVEAVTAAGGVPVVATSIAEAQFQLARGGAVGVVLSLDLKDSSLTPEAIRSLRISTRALVTLCDKPSLEQTVVAIRLGAAACLPRALASAQALGRELGRVLSLAGK